MNEKAIEMYEKIIKINPNNELAYQKIGSIYLELDEYEMASLKANTVISFTYFNSK